MDPAAHAAFTAAVASRLEADERVLGLVLLGSSAGRPDAWSDHDLWVIARAGRQEELRQDLSWLPPSLAPVLAFRETAHGLKVLGADGHLVELAVFDLDELEVTRFNRHRVVFDRGGVTERLAELAERPAPERPGPEHHLGQLVTCALVGALRHRRGEQVSGAALVTTCAARHLVELVEATVPTERPDVLDDLDPLRRFDLAYPAVARELVDALRQPTDAAAVRLLELARQTVEPLRPELAWEAVAVALRRIRSA